MNDDPRIARLEALLARVRSRSREQRGESNGVKARGAEANGAEANGVETSARPLEMLTAAATAPVPAAPNPFRPRAPSNPFELPTPAAAFRPSPLPVSPSVPPPQFLAKPPAPATHAPSDASLDRTIAEATTPNARPQRPPEPSQVRAIEPPPMEVIELDVDPDPSIPPPPVSADVVDEPLESRSRLVSAPPVPADQDEQDEMDTMDGEPGEEAPGYEASDPTIEVAAAEVSRAELDAIEGEDRAPSSSRRPISMEEKMSELDDDVSPLHAPPPESGRLPAAMTIDLAEVDSTGVRRHEQIERARGVEVPVVRAAPPAPAGHVEVAAFAERGERELAAKNFGELLEATLSL